MCRNTMLELGKENILCLETGTHLEFNADTFFQGIFPGIRIQVSD